MNTLSVIALAALLSACATNPAMRDAEQLALHRAAAGEPVQGFSYFGRMSSWTPLGPEAVAIYTGPSRAWLLEVDGPCNDLPFAQAIRLSSSIGRVSARFDDVTPVGTGLNPIPCRIREIRPIDVAALHAARARARASEGS